MFLPFSRLPLYHLIYSFLRLTLPPPLSSSSPTSHCEGTTWIFHEILKQSFSSIMINSNRPIQSFGFLISQCPSSAGAGAWLSGWGREGSAWVGLGCGGGGKESGPGVWVCKCQRECAFTCPRWIYSCSSRAISRSLVELFTSSVWRFYWLIFVHCFYAVVVVSHTFPAVYERYEDRVDFCARRAYEVAHDRYRDIDAKLVSKLPKRFPGVKKTE